MFWVLEVIMSPNAKTYIFSQGKQQLQMYENTLLNAVNSTIDKLDRKNWHFKVRKLEIQERIDGFEGMCSVPQYQCW